MTETVAEKYQGLDSWPLKESLKAIIDSNQNAVKEVENALIELEKAAQGIAEKLQKGGRLVYLGAGTSGRLAMQDAVELAPTFGFDDYLVLMAGGDDATGKAQEEAEDDDETAIKRIEKANISNYDAVIGLAASGNTPYTVAGIKRARELGAFTVGISNNPNTNILKEAEVGIFLDTGPEVLAGSTRLAAGTSQKIALNALSTAVLVKIGGAYDNLMVGMRAKNNKLHNRAIAMLQKATGASKDDARIVLEQSQFNIREAIIMQKTKLSYQEAFKLLKNHNNRVRDALEAYND